VHHKLSDASPFGTLIIRRKALHPILLLFSLAGAPLVGFSKALHLHLHIDITPPRSAAGQLA